MVLYSNGLILVDEVAQCIQLELLSNVFISKLLDSVGQTLQLGIEIIPFHCFVVQSVVLFPKEITLLFSSCQLLTEFILFAIEIILIMLEASLFKAYSFIGFVQLINSFGDFLLELSHLIQYLLVAFMHKFLYWLETLVHIWLCPLQYLYFTIQLIKIESK